MDQYENKPREKDWRYRIETPSGAIAYPRNGTELDIHVFELLSRGMADDAIRINVVKHWPGKVYDSTPER